MHGIGNVWELQYTLTFQNHLADIPGRDMNNDKLIVKCESNTFSLNNEVKPNPEESLHFVVDGYWIQFIVAMVVCLVINGMLDSRYEAFNNQFVKKILCL
jgi:hypothetical protein